MIRRVLVLAVPALALAAVLGLASSLKQAVHAAATERAALVCARTGIGTDQAIADCFTERGLPVPGDL